MNLDLFDDLPSPGDMFRERDTSRGNENSISPFPPRTPLAMAYVPYQQFGNVHSEEEALRCGTLFPELVFPFRGGDTDER